MKVFSINSDIKNAVSIGDCVKMISFPGGEIKFFEWLRKNGYLQSNNLPYQKYIDLGWFIVVKKVEQQGKSTKVIPVTLVTLPGLANLERKVLAAFPPCSDAALIKTLLEKTIINNLKIDDNASKAEEGSKDE